MLPINDMNGWSWSNFICGLFCGVAFVPILAGEKALTLGAVASLAWSTYSVSSAADGLGDVIEGTVTTKTKARVTVTTLGKTLWKLIWKVVNG